MAWLPDLESGLLTVRPCPLRQKPYSSSGQDIWFSTKKGDFDYLIRYKMEYGIMVITLVFDTSNLGSIPGVPTNGVLSIKVMRWTVNPDK